jgi:hypothetical protein
LRAAASLVERVDRLDRQRRGHPLRDLPRWHAAGGTGPSPAKSITLRLDHPFIFILRNIETGAVIFLGRVVDPAITG